MGQLMYDSSIVVDFDDRSLAHLHLVIGAKLRRGDGFFFGWKDDPAAGNGRSSIWVHPVIPIAFSFDGNQPPAINRAWVDALMLTANSSSGLQLIPEPGLGGG